MIALDIKDIGGGYVRRSFTSNGKTLRVGDTLTVDQIKVWPTANRRALINNGFVEVYPAAPASSVADRAPYPVAPKARKARA